ncbi:MAG: hypothetical protein D6814_09230 [Calditrichaeota bacterium]|nr:MAG: hypothetical protein D6814_09230 [Calditrichota bacterium]
MKKQLFSMLIIAVLAIGAGASAQTPAKQGNMYLVVGSEGPGFATPKEAIMVLEKGILPTFEALLKLKKEKKIVAAGLPLGDRAIIFVMQAASNSEVDKTLRSLPAWSALKWKVTALESLSGRMAQERAILEQLKKMTMK